MRGGNLEEIWRKRSVKDSPARYIVAAAWKLQGKLLLRLAQVDQEKSFQARSSPLALFILGA